MLVHGRKKKIEKNRDADVITDEETVPPAGLCGNPPLGGTYNHPIQT